MKKSLSFVFLLTFLLSPILLNAEQNTPPKITLLGRPTINLVIGQTFSDPGYRVLDREDAAEKLIHIATTRGININTPGTYSITYRVTDPGGLYSEAVRTVVVSPLVSENARLEFVASADQGESIVEVDVNGVTDDVDLLNFSVFERDSNIGVTVRSLKVRVNSSVPLSHAAQVIHLKKDNNVIRTQGIASTTSTENIIEFSNLNIFVPAGGVANLSVSADINPIPTQTFNEGSTLNLSITPVEIGQVVAVKENGVALSPAQMFGNVRGITKGFYTYGLLLDHVSSNVDISDPGQGFPDSGNFSIRFSAGAVGDDVYVNNICSNHTGGVISTTTVVFSMLNNQNLTPGICLLTSSAEMQSGKFLVEEGNTENFTLTSVFSPAVNTETRMILESVGYSRQPFSGWRALNLGLGTSSPFVTNIVNLETE